MYKLSSLTSAFVFTLLFCGVTTASADSLPGVHTVPLQNAATVPEGSVVVANEETGSYAVSQVRNDAAVYGVTVEAPPVVFQTAENEIPVADEGIVFMRVSASEGAIERGSLLVSGDESGVAIKAADSDDAVFAIALEGYALSGVGVIQAELNTEKARALRAEQIAARAALEQEEEKSFLWVRALIATVIAVGGLFFVLYTFRSTVANSVVSVGRNPRAKRSIMTLSVANIFFAVFLGLIVIFIALAVLVLPL